MKTIRTKQELVSVLGEDAIRQKLDLGDRAVSEALRRPGPFPAWWYIGCCELAGVAGVKCPHTLFAFGRKTTSTRRPSQNNGEAA